MTATTTGAKAVNEMTLGDTIRTSRMISRFGLRELAKMLEISPSYLSDIELNRRIPSEAVIRVIADTLRISFDDLMGLAGRFTDDADRHIKRYPEVGKLFRRIAEIGLHGKEIEGLIRQIERNRP